MHMFNKRKLCLQEYTKKEVPTSSVSAALFKSTMPPGAPFSKFRNFFVKSPKRIVPGKRKFSSNYYGNVDGNINLFNNIKKNLLNSKMQNRNIDD